MDWAKSIKRETALKAHNANDRALMLLSGYAGGEYVQYQQVSHTCNSPLPLSAALQAKISQLPSIRW